MFDKAWLSLTHDCGVRLAFAAAAVSGYTSLRVLPDDDECANDTICGNHGFCEKTDGSFRCHCDRGYTNPPGDTSRCVGR